MTWHNTIELSTGLWKISQCPEKVPTHALLEVTNISFSTSANNHHTMLMHTNYKTALTYTSSTAQPARISSELSARRCWQSKESTGVMISEESYKLGVTSNRACTRGSLIRALWNVAKHEIRWTPLQYNLDTRFISPITKCTEEFKHISPFKDWKVFWNLIIRQVDK